MTFEQIQSGLHLGRDFEVNIQQVVKSNSLVKKKAITQQYICHASIVIVDIWVIFAKKDINREFDKIIITHYCYHGQEY